MAEQDPEVHHRGILLTQAQLETEQAAMTHDELLDAIFRFFDKLDEIARRPSR